MNYTFENLPTQVASLTNEIKDLRGLIEKMVNAPVVQAEVMSVNDVSKLTGYSKNTIYQLVHYDKIPYHKPENGGNKLIFFRSEINEWLIGTKKESSEEYCLRKEKELLTKCRRGLARR